MRRRRSRGRSGLVARDVARRLRAARIGLAAVVDSRQKFTGIVALEDLVRQLVKA